ncbi:lysophospholipid acyltransferase family protein [Teredinibacter haidensis]|uniref:lysophospholipid acyltransferase family protein n=1 Tax=Teredinibacter haidensis TaxID=2731755 RepID=UPI0009488DBD|nr:lysophospholipid acyltransferase family protein [Teredinibacter haidensis]
MSRIKARIILGLLTLLGWMSLSVAHFLGAGIGRLAWRLNPREVKVTHRNIELCFPELSEYEQRQMVRASVLESAKLSIEILLVWQKPREWLMKRVVAVKGAELFVGEEGDQRGVILLAPHIGNWEVLGLYASTLRDMVSLYQPPKQAFLEPLMTKGREKYGAKLLPTDVKGVAGVLKFLKRGAASGILPDQVPADAGGRFANFFGQPAFTMTLICRLIEKTGCRVVAGAALRRPGGFEVVFQDVPQEIFSKDEETAVTAMNKAVEEVVALCPEQYQWEYKRFRKALPGEESVYRDLL